MIASAIIGATVTTSILALGSETESGIVSVT
jgi:hypothetical protein